MQEVDLHYLLEAILYPLLLVTLLTLAVSPNKTGIAVPALAALAL